MSSYNSLVIGGAGNLGKKFLYLKGKSIINNFKKHYRLANIDLR